MIYCSKKNIYVDQNITCIKCKDYDKKNDNCKKEEKQ